MKIKITLLLIGISLIRVSGQNSFEYTFTKYWSQCYSSFENEDYCYAVGVTGWEGPGYNAFITRFTDGNDLKFKEIVKQDTNTKFYFGVPKENGNILIVGNMNEHLYICEMNEDLNILNETYYYLIPEGFQRMTMFDMVVDQDSNLVLAGTYFKTVLGDTNSLALVRLNKDGQLIDYNNLVSIWYSGYQLGELLARQDGSGYYYFNGGSHDWIKIDDELQYITGSFFYPHKIGDAVTAKYLPDGNIAIVGVADVGSSDYDIVINIITDDLQWVYDTAFVEPGRQCPPLCKGLDFIDPDNIWIVAFNDWISPWSMEIYKIYICDSQFNVKGSKYYGGDNDYTFTYLKATNDGGCLVSGMIRREEGSTSRGAIIKKVMPEDILTGNDEKVFTDFKDVLVYPNPFTDNIFLNTDRGDLTFNLYNLQGERVYQSAIIVKENNELTVDMLQKGIYIYSITNSTGKAIDGGKLIKK